MKTMPVRTMTKGAVSRLMGTNKRYVRGVKFPRVMVV
jgi:hypothetical protein